MDVLGQVEPFSSLPTQQPIVLAMSDDISKIMGPYTSLGGNLAVF